MDLIPTPYPEIRGRPMWINWEGGRVWILFHDHAYLSGRRKIMNEIKLAHPDKGGSNEKTRKLLARLRQYEKDEARWYAKFGLTPPKGGRSCIGTESASGPLCGGLSTPRLLKTRFFYHHKGSWTDYAKIRTHYEQKMRKRR